MHLLRGVESRGDFGDLLAQRPEAVQHGLVADEVGCHQPDDRVVLDAREAGRLPHPFGERGAACDTTKGRDEISVIEHSAPCGESPPLHVHQDEDEVFHVLAGELRVRAGDAEERIGAGETILGPKGVAHTYRVESAAGARWLVITRGANFERFVRSLSRPAERPGLPPSQGPPTPEQADALAAAARGHGIELVGPPLD
jgi:mannose-6-phosphate isomerase-like protein (cupin superfamily)